MITYGQPMVYFGKTVINLAHVECARVTKVENYAKWTMTIQFTHDRKLYWSYTSEADAYDALKKFLALNETFIMNELP